MSAPSSGIHEEAALGKAYDARLIRRPWRYVRPHRGLVLASLVTMLAVSAAQLVQPYLIKIAIDQHIAAGRLAGLGTVAGLFLLALLGEFALRFAQLYVLQKTGQNVVLDLRMELFSHLQHLPSAFFDRNPVGRLMTRLTTDVEALNEAFTSGLVVILADLIKLVGIVAILLWMDWRLALVTFAILPPTLVLTRLFRDRMRAAYREVRVWVARVNAFLQENVSGMRVVQLFSREAAMRRQFGEINRAHRDSQLRGVRYDSIFSALAELIGSVTLAAIVWGGGWGVLRGIVTFGTLVAFIDYAGKFFGPVQELSQRYTVMQSAMAAAERIFALLDTKAAVRSPSRPYAAPGRLRGEIVFERVNFGYVEGEPVLHDVSFTIRPGQRIAVVGWTGSGKSTLIRLLIRLYDVWDGRILLDGVDVRDYDLQDLRRRVGIVLQDHFLFAGNVEGNISLGDPRVTPRRVREAAAAVHADRFIERLPRGYDEPVRERGSNFSVGQKQLLSFARAIAFDPAILVLDEATASVDPETEHHIREALATLLDGRTSIVIAHRLATLRDVDRILVLHHGRLVEQGTHDELVRLDAGIYRTLYTLQAATG
ncbi:MAG TPA: ABC transporter ATP-binding protein [Candidatus Polarisedimenticolaceae bacterium]|nr:ABC transporter ATP-binding protein [Candidatus Polarisedimenticolaceae bacterium]